MNDAFKIYVEQLRDGREEEILEDFSPDFMDVHDKDLIFKDLIHVEGKAYIAESTLILHLDITTFATIPCSICNEPSKQKVEILNFYHSEELNDIKSGIFLYQDLLRETILLETPLFGECQKDGCPERKKIQKYLKNTEVEGNTSPEEQGYNPFSNFEWKKD